MLYWGLTEHKLKVRIIVYAIFMHALVICSIYGSYVLYNSRILSIGAVYAKRNAQTARRATRVTLGKLSSLGPVIPQAHASLGKQVIVDSPHAQVLDNTESEREKISHVKAPIVPIKQQKADKISEPAVVIPKKLATKIDRSYTKLLRKNSDKDSIVKPAQEQVKEPLIKYSKLQPNKTNLLDQIREKKIDSLIEKNKQASEKQDAPKRIEPVVQKIEDKPKITDIVAPEIVPTVTSGSSEAEHDLVIAPDDSVVQELIAWEQELVLQVAQKLVLPAGFADREPITITVYVDLTGVPDIRNEMGCTIPALRAIVRKFFKNFAYPVQMCGKQRTFVIL